MTLCCSGTCDKKKGWTRSSPHLWATRERFFKCFSPAVLVEFAGAAMGFPKAKLTFPSPSARACKTISPPRPPKRPYPVPSVITQQRGTPPPCQTLIHAPLTRHTVSDDEQVRVRASHHQLLTPGWLPFFTTGETSSCAPSHPKNVLHEKEKHRPPRFNGSLACDDRARFILSLITALPAFVLHRKLIRTDPHRG